MYNLINQSFKMNTANMNYYETSNNVNLPKRITMLEFICLMSYLYIYYIIYKRTNAYFNKKEEKPVASLEEKKEEDLTLIRPVDEEDMETLQIYEFEGIGEQLRRLRAYNPKNDGETEEDYVSRIWSIADQEDVEEEKRKKIKVEEVKVEEVEEVKEKVEEVASSSKAEEKDVNTWYTIEDGLSRYKGEWKNGLPNGKGIKHFYKTNSYIEGNFVDSFAHGYGKQTFEQTQTWEKTVPYYEGEFKRNNYDGKGEYHFGDGDYYKGMWKNNKYHGQGATYSLRTNRTWVGEYCNDEKVEGNWVKGELEKVEVEAVASSSEAVASLEKDVNTWYKFADGKGRYKGEWKNGLPNGKGTKHSYKDDSYIYGNFVDGFSEGYGKQTFEQTWEKTQPYYEGEFKRNHYDGKGAYYYGDGDYYKGDWKDSKYHGQGTAYSLRLNKTWVGEYKNDEKVEGNWVKGEI